MSVLQILTPEDTNVVELPNRPVSIGRSHENDIVINDSRSSRKHCTVTPVTEGCIVQDLNSRNGTKHNGQRITEAVLRFGEAFCIGQTVLRILEKPVPVVELVDLSETRIDSDEEIDVPVAKLVEDEKDDELTAEEGMGESIVVRARRELNDLRAAGEDPGFPLAKLTLLDRHGRPVHGDVGADKSSEAVQTLRLLMYGAFRTRATDLHFEPTLDGCQLRYRVDGRMLPVVTLPKPVGRSVLSVVKVLAELDIARRNAIQEGSFSINVKRHVDCRVSFSPTTNGEKLVVRVLDTASIPATWEALGLSAVMLRQLRGACHMDSGMIVVSGPTGSGKTTTLYTALKSIDCKTRNVITIEDPIEYHIPGITQIQVEDKKGLSFSHILKSILRQDPDVILVGEIRDPETARTAMQAAMTGHLVFTTLHARDAIGSIFRLLDLNVESYMIANAVSICLAQRLIRVLCPHCKKSVPPKPSQLVRMNMQNRNITRLHTNVGCRRCMNVGFWGRTAIFEMLAFNDNLRDALMTTKTIHDIRRAAGEWTYETLVQSGYRRVADGLTTIEEVEHVASRD